MSLCFGIVRDLSVKHKDIDDIIHHDKTGADPERLALPVSYKNSYFFWHVIIPLKKQKFIAFIMYQRILVLGAVDNTFRHFSIGKLPSLQAEITKAHFHIFKVPEIGDIFIFYKINTVISKKNADAVSPLYRCFCYIDNFVCVWCLCNNNAELHVLFLRVFLLIILT